jgi:hypothetical protein
LEFIAYPGTPNPVVTSGSGANGICVLLLPSPLLLLPALALRRISCFAHRSVPNSATADTNARTGRATTSAIMYPCSCCPPPVLLLLPMLLLLLLLVLLGELSIPGANAAAAGVPGAGGGPAASAAKRCCQSAEGLLLRGLEPKQQ